MAILRGIAIVIAMIFVLTLAFGQERSAYDADLPLSSDRLIGLDGETHTEHTGVDESPFGENGELPSEMDYSEPQSVGFIPNEPEVLPENAPTPSGDSFSINELPRTGGLPISQDLSQEALTGESLNGADIPDSDVPDWFPNVNESNLDTLSPNISTSSADAIKNTLTDVVKRSPSELSEYGLLTLESDGFDQNVWQNLSRKKADYFLKQLSENKIQSPTVKKLIKRLLMTTATPPEGTASENWLATRVRALHNLGEVDSANLLLVSAGVQHADLSDMPSLHKLWAENMMMTGVESQACLEAQRMTLNGEDNFWHKALNVCLVLQGNKEGLRLRLDLIPETEQQKDMFFYALLHAYVDDEKTIPLVAPDQVLTPLEAVLFTSIERSLTPNVILLLPDTLLRQVSMESSYPMSLRLQAAEKLMNDFDHRDDLALLSLLYDKMTFDEKVVASPLVGKFAEEEIDGSKARALLWQAAKRSGLPSTRAMNISLLWDRAIQDDLQGLATKLSPNLRNIAADDNVMWFAPRVIRYGMLSEVNDVTEQWWRALSNHRNLSRDIVSERHEVRVLRAIASGQLNSKSLDAWWQTLSFENSIDYKRVERILTVLEASEIEVPSALWQQLQLVVDDSYISQEKGPGGLWLRVLGSALENRDVAHVLITLAQPVQFSSVEDLPSQTQSNMVTALRFIGLEDEANSIAYEAVIDLVENEPGAY